MDDEKQSVAALSYTITVSEYEKAFITFQKRYVFPKNIIMSAAFAVVIILYINQLYNDPTYSLAWILIGVCVASVTVIWYNSFKIRKSLIKAIKDIKDDRYTTTVYDDSLIIETEITQTDENSEPVEVQPRTIWYSIDSPEIMETDDMFIIYLKKQMFYVIPKRDLSESETSILRTNFQEKLEKRFIEMKK